MADERLYVEVTDVRGEGTIFWPSESWDIIDGKLVVRYRKPSSGDDTHTITFNADQWLSVDVH